MGVDVGEGGYRCLCFCWNGILRGGVGFLMGSGYGNGNERIW